MKTKKEKGQTKLLARAAAAALIAASVERPAGDDIVKPYVDSMTLLHLKESIMLMK